MKVFRLVLPHLTVSLVLALIVVTIVDSFNPAMAFLSSFPGRTLIYITATSALLTAIISVAENLTGQSRQIETDKGKPEQYSEDKPFQEQYGDFTDEF